MDSNSNQVTLSACLVVFNEEKVIQRCLESLKGLADEIIVVHDGDCADRTLEIARQYTSKVFVRPHAGMMEAHLVFAYKQASGEWLLRIDADEYFDRADQPKIKELLEADDVDAYIFKWEMWNGQQPIYFPGLQKMCLMRRDHFHYLGIPHAVGWVDGQIKKVDLFLHHRPKYDNIAWRAFWFKVKKLQWVPIHAKYFFPELVEYECFNTDAGGWLKEVERVKKNIIFYIAWQPLKSFFGQLKNGLFTSWFGLISASQNSIYYFLLYWQIWKMKRKLK